MKRTYRDIETMIKECGVKTFKLLRHNKHYVFEIITPSGPRVVTISHTPGASHKFQKTRSIIKNLMIASAA